MREKLRLGLPEDGRDRKSLIISIALHAVAIIAISGMAIVPILNLVRDARSVKPERVTYLQTPEEQKARVRDSLVPKPPAKQPPIPPKKQNETPPPPTVPPVASASPPAGVVPPTEVPVTIVVPPKAGGDSAVDTRIVGRGGVKGLSPGKMDPRLLGGGDPRNPMTGRTNEGPMTPQYAGTDTLIHAWVQQYWDSVAKAQRLNYAKAPDWTFQKGDKKYGIDQQWVYFGKFKVPTMLLGLIPINVQANPTIADRNRALASMTREIEYQALRAENSDEFERSVKELRARKEAEHQAKVGKKQ